MVQGVYRPCSQFEIKVVILAITYYELSSRKKNLEYIVSGHWLSHFENIVQVRIVDQYLSASGEQLVLPGNIQTPQIIIFKSMF